MPTTSVCSLFGKAEYAKVAYGCRRMSKTDLFFILAYSVGPFLKFRSLSGQYFSLSGKHYSLFGRGLAYSDRGLAYPVAD